MTKPPAWRVDPAWPAVPPTDDDEPGPEPGSAVGDPDDPEQRDLITDERAALAARVAELHVEGTRLQLRLHHAQRALERRPAAPAAAPMALPRNLGGRPRQLVRNDRLLALYETTAAHLPHLQRCRHTAQLYAAEVAAAAGLPPERARLLAATTVRDAVAEALQRRAVSRRR